MYKLGKFSIKSIDTCIFGLDGGAMFGVVPKNLWSKKYSSGDEQNRIPLAARPLLVEYDDKKILIDTGNGTKFPDKLAKIYNIDLEKSNIESALNSQGFNPDDISDVILTHLHFDHAGGSTKYVNNELVPVFKNAKYYVQKEHFDWAMNPTDKDRASFMKDDYLSLKSDGLLELIDGPGELFPGIELINIYGHTKALQMVKLQSAGQSLLYLADLCPTNAHLHYPFIMGYDNYPLTTLEERKKYLPIAYEENTILFFEHDAFIKAGKLKANDKGFELGEVIEI
ncbi:MAG TPA: MBL fold metallo-hydrolase [Candidatus Kapabacteria bacterium]|nr:MBL fold metallo-hydrolase [Candidatus Kapabacteria bacterium]